MPEYSAESGRLRIRRVRKRNTVAAIHSNITEFAEIVNSIARSRAIYQLILT